MLVIALNQQYTVYSDAHMMTSDNYEQLFTDAELLHGNLTRNIPQSDVSDHQTATFYEKAEDDPDSSVTTYCELGSLTICGDIDHPVMSLELLGEDGQTGIRLKLAKTMLQRVTLTRPAETQTVLKDIHVLRAPLRHCIESPAVPHEAKPIATMLDGVLWHALETLPESILLSTQESGSIETILDLSIHSQSEYAEAFDALADIRNRLAFTYRPLYANHKSGDGILAITRTNAAQTQELPKNPLVETVADLEVAFSLHGAMIGAVRMGEGWHPGEKIKFNASYNHPVTNLGLNQQEKDEIIAQALHDQVTIALAQAS